MKATPAAPRRKSSTFKGDVLRLVSGTGIAQIIGVIAAPVLTRLYAPEAFGMAALFISVSAMVSTIACLRYELSIVMPEDDREAANLVAGSFLAAVLVAGLSVPAVWFSQEHLALLLRMPQLASFLWLVPAVVLLQGVFQALNYWNSRTKKFTRLSITRVTGALTTTSAQIGGGLAGYATGGTMIAANVGGQAVATAILGGQILRDDGRYFTSNVRWREVFAGLRRYRKFPLYSTWSGLLNTASWQLPALMLGAFFSSATVGFYALGFRILQMPMSLVGDAISQVFLQRAAVAKGSGTLPQLVERLFSRLVMVGLFPIVLLLIVAEDLYVVVFGAGWGEAGVYTQILSLWGFVWFVSSPLARLFFVLGMQEFGLKLNVMIFLSRLASLSIGGYYKSIYVALGLYAFTGLLLYGYQVLVVLRSVDIPLSSAWRILERNLFYSAPFAVVLLGLAVFDFSSMALVVAAAVSLLLYAGFILSTEFRDGGASETP